MRGVITLAALLLVLTACTAAPTTDTYGEDTTVATNNPIVLLETNKGNITVELNREAAPQTVANFLNYVDEGFYDGTLFHRVMNEFMIQGGGFTTDGVQKQTHTPIPLESNNGLQNDPYTIAMARTSNPNSATAQFFINVANNANLDYRPGNPGYAVFGKVIEGEATVDAIKAVSTGTKVATVTTGQQASMADWPVEDVVILRASIK